MEFALAARRAEAAFGEGQERLAAMLQAHGVLAVQLFQRDAVEEGMAANRAAVRIMSSSVSRKQGSSKPMRCGQQAEDFDVGLRLAGRGQRGPRQLQIVVAVGEVEVGVFQERGGGQHDVGEIGGVGLELFEHHGEQIVAAQAAQHGVLIGRDGGGVRVVDHQRFHGRIVERRSAPRPVPTC